MKVEERFYEIGSLEGIRDLLDFLDDARRFSGSRRRPEWQAVVREGRPYPPSSARDLRIFPDARVSLDDLKDAGFLLIVVTNQPDVARGTLRRETLNSINQAIAAALPVDEIVTCCHDDADGCACRKPKPGLLIDAASRHKIDRHELYDRHRRRTDWNGPAVRRQAAPRS